jgi:MYXO-CTERM domain-containing protein
VATSVDSGWQTTARLNLLFAMLARPDIAELTRLFASPSESDTAQAYLLSALLVHDLRERHGPAIPGAIAGRVAAGVPFVEAFRLETGVTPGAAADEAWAGYRRWTAWVPAVTSPSAAWTMILVLALVAFLAQRRRRARSLRRWDDEDFTSPE